jgi:LPS sulfotransferase NodH
LLLKKEIFRTYPKKMKAVGFKVFYYHAQNDNWRSVWTYLQAQRDLKILHLKRKNVLKTHLSRKRAGSSGKWINLTGEKEMMKPIILDYEECLEDFTRTRGWEKEYDVIFENHEILNVYYENLQSDNYGELCRIQGFLGVKKEELKAMTHQQTNQPLSQAIANYYELKKQFKDTAWAESFEE